MTKYLSCAETAKLVRKALKENFPSTKFSVRSNTYAGGASIDVSWNNGPAYEQVNKIVKGFEGAGFDGMQDYKYYIRHWMLPDGSLVTASSEGYRNDQDKPHEDAELISFGADYIFCRRDIDLSYKVEAAQKILTDWGIEAEDMTEDDYYQKASMIRVGSEFLTDHIYRHFVNLSITG